MSRVATLVPKVMLATANSSCLEYKKDKQADPFSRKDFGNLVRDLLRQKAYLGHYVYWHMNLKFHFENNRIFGLRISR